jgi:hypothetical protein
MRGRRSSRSAAVVLAGCVGLAVMAPGLALATPITEATTPTACAAADGTWNSTTERCEEAGAGSTGSTTGSSNTTSGDTANGTGTAAGSSDGGTAGTGGQGTANQDAGSPSNETNGTQNEGTETERTQNQGTETVGTGNEGTGNEGTGHADVPQINPAGRLQLQSTASALAGAAPAAVTNPLAGLISLPGLPDLIPTPDAGGNFENVNDACLNAIGQLQFPEGTTGLDVLSEQLQGFCSNLDPTALTDLLGNLIDLLNNLIPSLPTTPGTIPDQAPHTVPAEYWGYWNHHYDVDCPELTYDEANAILAGDPSDPFRLDGDNDGEACEDNPHGDAVAYADYIGYPVGGVATGDGSTDTSGASGVEVALAASMLSGLGLTGLVLVRRFARQG